MKRQINIDYIGVVRKESENYLYYEREIATNKKLIDRLQAIAEYIEEQCRLIMEELPTLIARQQQKIDKLNQRLDPLTATWLEIKKRLDENPENAETLISQGPLDERIDTILNEIIARNDFMKSLQQCYAKITKSGIL